MALLYRYAREDEKASTLLDYAFAEGAEIAGLVQNKVLLFELYRTLTLCSLMRAELTSARLYLSALKTLSDRSPDERLLTFSPPLEAIAMMLRGLEQPDAELAEEALAYLSAHIETKEQQPDGYHGTFERDISEILRAVCKSPVRHERPELRTTVEMVTSEQRAQLTDRANYLVEYALPEFGLEWQTAERLARIYKVLQEEAASRRYFAKAAQLANEALLNSQPRDRKPDQVVETASSRLHIALLYGNADQMEHAEAHLQQLAEQGLDIP